MKNKTITCKRDMINKKMRALNDLRSDYKIVKSGNKKLSHSSNKESRREKRLIFVNKPSFFRKNAVHNIIKCNLPIIVKTSILIFVCDVLITQCSSQIDLGM